MLNRAVRRARLFEKAADDLAFERVLEEARRQAPMRLLALCLMPNHWYLVVLPADDGDLSESMRWLSVTHTQRWHAAHHTSGTGALYQGRFQSFPVPTDEHFLTVCRHVVRNALRANLVDSAEGWRWGSLWQRAAKTPTVTLDEWPVPIPGAWRELVNQPQTEAELVALRRSVVRGAPFGDVDWQQRTANALPLDSALRPQGHPRKVRLP